MDIAKKYLPEKVEGIADRAFKGALKDGFPENALDILRNHLAHKTEDYFPAVIDGMIKEYEHILFKETSRINIAEASPKLNYLNALVAIHQIDRNEIKYTNPLTQRQEALHIDERLYDIHKRKIMQVMDNRRYTMTAALDIMVRDEDYEMAAIYRDALIRYDEKEDLLREKYTERVKKGLIHRDRMR
jgi:hypothetical protein